MEGVVLRGRGYGARAIEISPGRPRRDVSLPDAEADDGETLTLGLGGTLPIDVTAGPAGTSTVIILDPTDRGRTEPTAEQDDAPHVGVGSGRA